MELPQPRMQKACPDVVASKSGENSPSNYSNRANATMTGCPKQVTGGPGGRGVKNH